MIRLLITLLLSAAVWTAGVSAELRLTLDEAVATARIRSVDAAVALNELKAAYWEWRAFRADQLPEMTFSAKVPGYTDSYSSYMNSDGEFSFVRSNYLEAVGQLTVTQNVRLTGGRISVVSSLDFLHQYGQGAGNRFMSLPVAVTLRQPLFGVNTMKWDSRIEPLRFTEAKAAFLSATEDVALRAVEYFFALLLSKENLTAASQNLENSERLYAVAVEKRRMGQISQNDLLQMELNLLEAQSGVTDCETAMRSDMFRLCSFLDLETGTEIVPVVPDSVPDAKIGYDDALRRALANNKFATGIRRRQLEADYAVAQAKGNLRQINLFAQIGTTGAATGLSDSYRHTRGNQVVEIGVEIPLVDWGKRRGRVRVAESNRRVTEARLRREEMDFSQDLFVLVERFDNQRAQLDIAYRSSDIARRRYATNVETYMIGKISTLDLNDSQTRKDDAMRRYVSELYKFWVYWYQIRSLTLYDYEHGGDINADFDRMIRM